MTGEKLSDLLLIFRAVVDTDSFSAAGRRLNMSPAWVAKQVTRLEEHLEAALLIRSTRALRLTDAGHECYRTAGVVAEELEALKDKLHTKTHLMSGTVRINAPSVAALDILPQAFAAFQIRYPNLKLDTTVSDNFVDVLNEDVDIVFRIARSLSDSSAIAKRIGDVPRVLCASVEYLADAPPIKCLQDLQHHKALMFSNLQTPSSWFLKHGTIKERITPNITFQANNSYVLKRSAINGSGIAFLPKVIVEMELRLRKLVHLNAFTDAAPFKLYVLRAPQKHLPARTQAAWNFFSNASRT
ncbi:LysR family transcriptional regulator [Pelagibacterium sp.]|uniref:LysR family transcriptional regulator n=1 Tax=Pelagibacterium sp. TaxID=1967288 RepID=UPI003A8DF66A